MLLIFIAQSLYALKSSTFIDKAFNNFNRERYNTQEKRSVVNCRIIKGFSLRKYKGYKFRQN